MQFLWCTLVVTVAIFTNVDGVSEWYTLENHNACNTPTKAGPCGKAKDAPGFHFVGTLPNATACQATCDAATTDCPIWLYSARSNHCWWRLDNVWAPTNLTGVTSGCRQIAFKGKACVAGCGQCPVAPTPAPLPTPAPIPFIPSREPNMNGEYLLSQTPNGHNTQKLFPAQYRDYPRGAEYFDLYSPMIKSLYSQVFWTGLGKVPLPKDFVKRYAGKGMAVIGFEMDQVRRTPSGDVSVPISAAYNHHFESNMVGAKSRLEKVIFDGPDDPRIAQLDMGHGVPKDGAWIVNDLAPDNAIPTNQAFGGANGGEYRKTFHGYAPGFAQIIESPQYFQITPMQIDTWNRDKMNLTGPTRFFSGPLPRNSLSPKDGLYSGLLECPVTTRVRTIVEGDYLIHSSGTCTDLIATPSECFEAAISTLGSGSIIKNIFINQTGFDLTKPPGCSVITDPVKDNTIHVYFNTASSKSLPKCGGNDTLAAGVTSSLVKVLVELDVKKKIATINLTGPAQVWFGVGFNGSSMKDAPWTIIVDGQGNVTERKLADQNPGKELSQSVTIVSRSLVGGLRTVIMTRPFKGATSDHFTFDPVADTTLRFINAIGNSAKLSYHKDKLPSTLFLLPTNGGVCICPIKPAPFGQGKGKFLYVPTEQSADVGKGLINYGNKCAPQPRTDLLAMKNPTCDVRTYAGGQTTCHHMWSLLDADQEIPWVDQPLEYQLKFRFWVQPYNESYHKNAKRTTWGIASPVEYDVPKCAPGIMGCSQQADGNWIHTIRGTFKGNGKLLAAHFHCHAPTCLSFAMYKCDKGVKNCNATTGTLLCHENPVYGGTGKIDNKDMDEPGFILQPPCIWGSPEFGLEPPPDVSGLMLHSVKISNSTFGHHGEMAWQQMYYY